VEWHEAPGSHDSHCTSALYILSHAAPEHDLAEHDVERDRRRLKLLVVAQASRPSCAGASRIAPFRISPTIAHAARPRSSC